MNPYYTPYDYFDMPIFDRTFDFNKCTLTTDLYVEEIDKKVGKKGIIDLFSKYGSLHDMTMNLFPFRQSEDISASFRDKRERVLIRRGHASL